MHCILRVVRATIKAKLHFAAWLKLFYKSRLKPWIFLIQMAYWLL